MGTKDDSLLSRVSLVCGFGINLIAYSLVPTCTVLLFTLMKREIALFVRIGHWRDWKWWMRGHPSLVCRIVLYNLSSEWHIYVPTSVYICTTTPFVDLLWLSLIKHRELETYLGLPLWGIRDVMLRLMFLITFVM